MKAVDDAIRLTVGEHEVSVSHPDKVLFPATGTTKMDVVEYFLAVAPGALRGSGGRPNTLVRYPDGIAAPFFYQKRAPRSRPPWVEIATITFPSGRQADEIVPRHAADLAWMANLACLELHPHPTRATDLVHPDELRIDLDPVEGVPWESVRTVAQEVRGALDRFGMIGWIKTSGKRGLHILVRIYPRWAHDDVRRAALALARDVEGRIPKLATSKWWKEERHGVFIDYNQNAKDRTVAGAYSIRPTPLAQVSAPLVWDELGTARPEDFTLATMPGRFKRIGDPHAAIDEHPCSLENLLALADHQVGKGMKDAPWPPHYAKGTSEPRRAPPSREHRAVSEHGIKTRTRRTPPATRTGS